MQNLNTERIWHEQKFYVDSGHWTSWPIFASRERHWLKNDQEKIRFYGYLHKYLKSKAKGYTPTILFAPIGNGDDVKYIVSNSKRIHGIDISPIALEMCPRFIDTVEGDILRSGSHLSKIGFSN